MLQGADTGTLYDHLEMTYGMTQVMALKQENMSGQRLEQVVLNRVEGVLSNRLDTLISRTINHRHGSIQHFLYIT
jgi:ribosomal protein S4